MLERVGIKRKIYNMISPWMVWQYEKNFPGLTLILSGSYLKKLIDWTKHPVTLATSTASVCK
jgi:hypothetical protein